MFFYCSTPSKFTILPEAYSDPENIGELLKNANALYNFISKMTVNGKMNLNVEDEKKYDQLKRKICLMNNIMKEKLNEYSHYFGLKQFLIFELLKSFAPEVKEVPPKDTSLKEMENFMLNMKLKNLERYVEKDFMYPESAVKIQKTKEEVEMIYQHFSKRYSIFFKS